ncbi:MAG: hypothetical protein L6R38_005051 [Xanthoria sp. 2 TBL-2021]|nr:MAG: hypothetical protein L6R38_005051 [Xanthoria sp. 2 TBL-2021]
MASPLFHVKAIYEYSSPHDDDLSFPIGQVINVTEQEGDDWYYGEYADQSGNKKEGLFPRNFVKNYEPETPPRPTRLSRSKKETESSAPSQESRSTAQPATAVTSPPNEERAFTAEPLQETAPGTAEPTKAMDQSSGASRVQAEPKSALSASSKPPPPPASGSAAVEKPSSGSFRDRINAFNKPAAPPVASTKPSGLGTSGGSGFVKKAFVVPPPSKNAYVPLPREAPPQKIYNREEQLEAEAQLEPTDESEPPTQPTTQQSGVPVGDEDDQPKPTSLKERIALLQKQQMEQAARHAEAAQKKEKPKRPPKKRMESQERMIDNENIKEDDMVQRIDSGEGPGKRSVDVPRVLTDPKSESTRDPESSEITPILSPAGHPRQIFSDGNDADVSGAADTEGEDMPTSRDELDQRSQGIAQRPSHRLPEAPTEQQDVGEKQTEDAEDDEEEEEVDPEVKKRMEIRERMAKMSGGMGMAGMFGPPGGMAPMPPRRQVPSSSERKSSGNERSATGESVSPRAPLVSMMPMPGLTKVRSPEQEATLSAQVSKEEENDVPMSITQGCTPTDMPDVEDLKEEPVLPSRRSTDRQLPPPIPHERPVPPPPPSKAREAPPLPPTERPVPPPPPQGQPLSPSEGSESDDEMSVHARTQSLRVPTSDESRPVSREGPPPVPSNGPPPTLPSRPRGPPVEVPFDAQSVDFASKETSPTSPSTPSAAAKRLSRPPPIPGSVPAVPPPTPQTRAPPPPPPGAPPSRVATGEMRSPPPIPKATAPAPQDSDEEVTEYEGDYDTDIAPGASHKTALKSYSKEPVRDSNSDKDSGIDALQPSGLPPLGAAPSVPPRAVPPLPPTQAPKGPRQSTEIPRGAPPPPPPTKELPSNSYEEEEYDPYNYSVPSQRVTPATDRGTFEQSTPSRADDQDDLYSASPPRRNVPPSPAMSSSQYASPPSLSAPSRSAPRQSLDVQRTSTSGRRSMEAPRVSSDHGFIAGDIELDPGIQWWTQPNMPPPVLQNRRDVIYETEDSTTTRRGGRQAITRNIYALYMDYSQTIVAAHFEARDPSEASLEQHHEPPPSQLRQDQLEDAHTRFGTRIAEGASAKKDTVVGDGSPNALVLDLMASLPDALRPVGSRAYGALVYANLANASVQQFDEIRAGDIVTFRNAKFQGHRGPVRSKYSGDVGKPDHVAIVVDWDGTKKKVRAWEQGRESKKVKLESFKLGDMKSGEVKVWRVMARQWVGWE